MNTSDARVRGLLGSLFGISFLILLQGQRLSFICTLRNRNTTQYTLIATTYTSERAIFEDYILTLIAQGLHTLENKSLIVIKWKDTSKYKNKPSTYEEDID